MSVLTISEAISRHRLLYVYRVHIWPLPQRNYYTKDEVNSFLNDYMAMELKLYGWNDEGNPIYVDVSGKKLRIPFYNKSFSCISLYDDGPILRDGVKFYISTRKSKPEALLNKIEMVEGSEDKNHEWLYHFLK